MALINCPECGKEVSDKSEKCIHCGYPIKNTQYLYENINGINYDISFIVDKSDSQIEKIKQLVELTNCDLFTAKEIVLKYQPTIVKETCAPRCPHCKSTNIKSISTLNRGASIVMWGIFSKKINKSFECLDCKYTW